MINVPNYIGSPCKSYHHARNSFLSLREKNKFSSPELEHFNNVCISTPVNYRYRRQKSNIKLADGCRFSINTDCNSVNVKYVKNISNCCIVDNNCVLIINGYMEHYGHCLLDSLPAYEYMRARYPNRMFLIPKDSPIYDCLLCVDYAYWIKHAILYTHGDNYMLKGMLTLYDNTTTLWSHRSHGGCADLINTLNISPVSDDCNRIVYCPRNQSTGVMNGRYQTADECDAIQDIIRDAIKDTQLKLSTFNPVTQSGFLPVIDQKKIFQDAHTVVGLRGSALHNIIWSSRFVNSDQPPLNIIEIIPCNTTLNNIIPLRDNNNVSGDYRNRRGDALGSYIQYSDEFNGRWYHIFYTVKEDSDYVYTDLRSLNKLVLNIITNHE